MSETRKQTPEEARQSVLEAMETVMAYHRKRADHWAGVFSASGRAPVVLASTTHPEMVFGYGYQKTAEGGLTKSLDHDHAGVRMQRTNDEDGIAILWTKGQHEQGASEVERLNATDFPYGPLALIPVAEWHRLQAERAQESVDHLAKVVANDHSDSKPVAS